VSATTGGSEGGYDVRPKQLIGVPIETVYNATLEAIRALDWTVVSESDVTHYVEAKTPISLSTWGDNLTVSITEQHNHVVRVDVYSETGYQITDWGKNKQNIIDLYLEIDKVLLFQ